MANHGFLMIFFCRGLCFRLENRGKQKGPQGSLLRSPDIPVRVMDFRVICLIRFIVCPLFLSIIFCDRGGQPDCIMFVSLFPYYHVIAF